MNSKQKVLILVAAVLLIMAAYLLSRDGSTLKAPIASFFTPEWRDLGEISVSGDGLPGYDTDRNGKPDYVETGFFPYVELYRKGGFEYSGGDMHLKVTGANVTLPALSFAATELTESSVGSVVIFDAVDNSSSVKASIIVKTLGRSVNTYTLLIESTNPAYSYRITDILDEKGSGTFEKGEIEGTGIIRL